MPEAFQFRILEKSCQTDILLHLKRILLSYIKAYLIKYSHIAVIKGFILKSGRKGTYNICLMCNPNSRLEKTKIMRRITLKPACLCGGDKCRTQLTDSLRAA